MAKRYRGDNRIGMVKPEEKPGYSLRVKLKPQDVHLFRDLIQGHGHLTFPAELNPKDGLIILHTTPECFEDLLTVIAHLPFALEIIT